LLPDGYAGLQPIDAGMANVCFVFGVTTFQTLGQRSPQRSLTCVS
jgi:hypothetical protein